MVSQWNGQNARVLHDAPLNTSRFCEYTTGNDLAPAGRAVGFPFVVEPRSLNGRLGLIRADDQPQLEVAIEQTAKLLCAADAAQAIGLRTGPVHAELRLDDQGPWIIEIAGCTISGLCSQSLELAKSGSLEETILHRHAACPMDR